MQRSQEPARLEAVDDVVLLARLRDHDAMQRFYAQIVGLLPTEPADGDALRFRSEQFYLRIRTDENALINPNIRRAIIVVTSLDELAHRLDENQIERETQRGLAWASRRIFAADPAGNRIEFKQYWPL